MFRPTPAIFRFSSERVLVLWKIYAYILQGTNSLSEENLMMAGVGRNM